MKLALVVPTIRPERHKEFLEAWKPLIDKHKIEVISVFDGDEPYALVGLSEERFSIADVMGKKYTSLIFNHTDAVRNLGFALAYKRGADVIFSFDDDVLPVGDTIQNHLNALNSRACVSWVNTAYGQRVRGFPYGVRTEAPVLVSHGVWKGVPDLDAPTQLVTGTKELQFPAQVIPRGVLFPFCAMNFAFKRDAMPFIYQAPMFGDVARFADIWGGIEMKKDIDAVGGAVVSGFAYVFHTRASNVFKNLQQEARGIEMNEEYGKDEYFKTFFALRERWKKFCDDQHQVA